MFILILEDNGDKGITHCFGENDEEEVKRKGERKG